MRLVPVIIDCHVQLTADGSGVYPLLSSPAGTGVVLDRLMHLASPVTDEKPIIAPDFPITEDYEARMAKCSPESFGVVALSRISRWAVGLESEDYLLIIEPRRWPLDGFGLHNVGKYVGDYLGVTHLVAVGRDTGELREKVSSDEYGHVRRVDRLYNQVSWPESAADCVVYSVLPAKLLANTGFSSLGELRSVLAVKGSLSRDIPLQSDLIDAGREHGLLALHEQLLYTAMKRGRPTNYAERDPGVWIGPGCRIGNNVRFVPPIILQSNVQVDDGATIVGPTTVGAEARICSNAKVAQSLISQLTVVGSGVSVCHRAVSGICEQSLSGQAELPDPSVPVGDPGWCDWDAGHHARTDTFPWRAQMALKRLVDIVLSALGILLFLPVMMFTAIAIKLDSTGPVFFRHSREGRGGKEFDCLKFRTMVAHAHALQRELYKNNEVDGPQFKMKHDPRLTRLGRFLRTSNIDELPQLFNVLVGQMSLVGPRPSPFRENQVCVPWRRARLAVRPGITGLWQLCRNSDRGLGDFHEWIFYDIAYVRNFSLWLDFRILLMTVLTLGGMRRVPLSRFVPDSDRPTLAPEEFVTVGLKA
jgi:lipopolysaccharide/colanic/teichoic acid biosynthesis glycosyltransferase